MPDPHPIHWVASNARARSGCTMSAPRNLPDPNRGGSQRQSLRNRWIGQGSAGPSSPQSTPAIAGPRGRHAGLPPRAASSHSARDGRRNPEHSGPAKTARWHIQEGKESSEFMRGVIEIERNSPGSGSALAADAARKGLRWQWITAGPTSSGSSALFCCRPHAGLSQVPRHLESHPHDEPRRH